MEWSPHSLQSSIGTKRPLRSEGENDSRDQKNAIPPLHNSPPSDGSGHALIISGKRAKRATQPSQFDNNSTPGHPSGWHLLRSSRLHHNGERWHYRYLWIKPPPTVQRIQQSLHVQPGQQLWYRDAVRGSRWLKPA